MTFPLMSPSRYGTSVAGSMEVSSIMPEDPEDLVRPSGAQHRGHSIARASKESSGRRAGGRAGV